MKRFLWALSGIIPAVLMFLAHSSVPVSAFSPNSTDNINISQFVTYFDGGVSRYHTCNDTTSNATTGCSVPYSASAGDFTISGFRIIPAKTIPSGSYVNFTVFFAFSDFPQNLNFRGFDFSFDGSIVYQDVFWDEYANSRYLTVQVEIYTSVPLYRIDLFGANGSIALSGASQSNAIIISMNSLHVRTGNSDKYFFDKLQGVQNSLDAANNNLSQIANGSISVNIDKSGLATSASQQATTDAINAGNQQAHLDAQSALREQEKQTSIQEEQKNFVTDTSTPEASDIANSDSLPSVGLLPAGPLDSILLLPVNILNSIIQSFGGSCKPVVAPLPFIDDSITWPCMDDIFYKGDFEVLANIVGTVASALILFGYFKHLYKKVDRAVSLETTDEDEWGIL